MNCFQIFLMLPVLHFVLCLAVPEPAQEPGGIGPEDIPEFRLRLNRILLQRIEPDRYQFDAEVELNASVAVKVESFSFASMRLNEGIPLFIAPLTAHLAIVKNVWTELPPLRLTIYAADLPSLALLQEVVHTRQARVQGEICAGIQLSLLQRLWIGTLHATAAWALDQQVPLESGAVDPWTAGGLMLGSLVESGAKTVRSVLRLDDSATDVPFQQQVLRSVVIVHTSYLVQEGSTISRRGLDRLGFWIAPHLLAVPEEVLEPWAYVPSLMARSGHDSKNLNISLEDIAVRPTLPQRNDGVEWRRSRGDFTVAWRGNPEKERLILSAHARGVEILSRGSAAKLAVLQFRDGTASEPLGACARNDCGAEVQRGLAVIRENAETGNSAILSVQGSLGTDGVSLSRPLDERCFGSPVVSQGGTVGMVGSETTVVPIEVILARAGLESVAARGK